MRLLSKQLRDRKNGAVQTEDMDRLGGRDVHCAYKELWDPTVLLLEPIGAAAYAMSGRTLHFMYRIPVESTEECDKPGKKILQAVQAFCEIPDISSSTKSP